MEHLVNTPNREVDLGLLIFVQRYATDLLRWDLLDFFAHHPEYRGSINKIAQQLGRGVYSVQPEIGDLVLLGILERDESPPEGPHYFLTTNPTLRRMTLKFAAQLGQAA